MDDAGSPAVAEMVVGLGNDVLTTPCEGAEDTAMNSDPTATALRERLEVLEGSRPRVPEPGTYLDDFEFPDAL